MKVKNIMFSGVMAAILGATGANAAINVASQGYVDSKVGAVETNITNNYLSKTDAADTYLTEEQVTQQITNVVGTADEGLLADVAANKAAIATKANTADVYSKEEADAKFEEQAEATKKLAESKEYTDSQIKELTDSLGGVGEDGESTGLTGTVAAQGVRIGALEDKVGVTSVADQIATALTTAQGYADTAESDAIASAKEYSDSLAKNYDAAGSAAAVEAKLADYTKTSELNATFATDEELKAVDGKFANYTTTEALNTTLADYAKQSALTAEETARKEADQAATNALSGKQDSLSETQLAAVNSGVTSETVAQVATNAGAISELESDLATKITMPEVCATTNCVLSTLGGTIQWVPLTEPLDSTASN